MRPAAPARLRPPQTLGAGVALCAALLLAACAGPPVATAPADTGPWPELLPLGPILSDSASQPVAADSTAAPALAADAARAAALRARADRLLTQSP